MCYSCVCESLSLNPVNKDFKHLFPFFQYFWNKIWRAIMISLNKCKNVFFYLMNWKKLTIVHHPVHCRSNRCIKTVWFKQSLCLYVRKKKNCNQCTNILFNSHFRTPFLTNCYKLSTCMQYVCVSAVQMILALRMR